ncbi:hypothetical protein HPB47_006147 [Ixodes persulcatus]|uniref:Uncharacterized protein n=1 Tax=Ixodes persulcatus TaxID=34615 RepID=A0AC60PBE5_IXOPE|nr:hypothetical protein HPB47_006147 [Ixodes persulcatus]
MSTTICALLVVSTKEASTKKEVNWDCPTPDTHLLSLWDHHTRKLTEYRNTKDRNTLKEVNRITAEAEEYARKLRVNNTPVPRNMGLDQPERRRDYAQKHLTVVTTKLEDPTAIVLYTDAAHKNIITTSAWHDLRQNKSWSRETKTAGTPEEAEAQAILHALEHVTQSLNPPVKTVDIYTDVQEDIRRCRKHDPNSPTTRRILALARRLESKNVKADCAPANSGKTGPRKQDETRDRTPYDPEDAMRKVRQDIKKRLLASLPREPDPIPLGRYSRKKMILLRRIRTGSAVTPHDRRKWELSAGKIGRNRPPVSAASPPVSPPQPQQMQRQHSLEQP